MKHTEKTDLKDMLWLNIQQEDRLMQWFSQLKAFVDPNIVKD